MVLLNFLAAPAWGTTENARSLVAEGNRLFAAGKYEEAGQLYERAAEMAPDSPVPLFNRAASLFQQGDYAAATKLYEQARVQAPEAMRQQINYAMGNCHLQQAIQSRPTPPQALKEAQAATQYYRDSIPSGPTASDETAQAARHNLELTRRLIKQLEEQQAQQQEQQQEQQGQQQQQQQANQGQQQEQQQSQDQQRPAEGQEQQPQEGADQSRGQPQDQPSRQETSKAGETSDTAPEQKDSGNEKKLQQPRDAGKHMSSEEATDRLRSAISRAQAARSRRISEQQKKASGFRVEKDW